MSDAKTRPESLSNLTGRTRYVDDLPEPAFLLHGVPVVTKSAKGRGLKLDFSAARAVDPSVVVLSAPDVPGENRLDEAPPADPLFAFDEWFFKGQTVALVLAKDRRTARRAAALVGVSGEDLPPVVDPREAFAKGDLILKPMSQAEGDIEAAFRAARWTVSGRCDSGGQEHVYLETQSSLAYPEENGRFKVVSSTQSPTHTQHAVARVLGVGLSDVEIEAGRLGGGFGGKEDQASPWAALAALGAKLSGRPVKIVLSRQEDLRYTGKRHPYSTDYRIALGAGGKILGFEATYYQNAGCTTDLSPAILSRTLFHAAGAYRIPAVKATGYMCRTNLPSFTAYRGFGAPQAFFAVESALDAAAAASGIPADELRRINLLSEGDVMHYGQKLARCNLRRCWDELEAGSDIKKLRAEIEAFNKSNRLLKRGLALQPVCFGISFTKLMLNQGGALVHVYTDGTVSVATGAIEMGQGVTRKILVAAARTLGLPESKVRVEKTSTATVANTSATAASTGSDINAAAARNACAQIRERLLAFAAGLPEAGGAAPSALDLAGGRLTVSGKASGLGWEDLVSKAYAARVDLSAHGFYATPGLTLDLATGKGSPFAYHVYGVALVVAELDVLRGNLRVERTAIVHDGGASIDPLVDRCQIEGALAQSLGWALLEELRFAPDGTLTTDSLGTYKLPDAKFMDFPLDIRFLEDVSNPLAVLGSKAIGEPPFVYGIAGYFAALEALRAAKPGVLLHSLPLTGEKALAVLNGRSPC